MLQYTTDRNTSVPMSAHDRSSPHRGLFLRPDGCNIAPGTAPALEAVAEAFQSFHKKFFAADFCYRQITARSARPGGVPESRHLNYQTDDNHKKEDRTPDNDRSQSPQV